MCVLGRRTKKTRQAFGFSLLEVLAIITILAIIAVVIIPHIS